MRTTASAIKPSGFKIIQLMSTISVGSFEIFLFIIPSRHTTSYRRLIDVETTLCVYWDAGNLELS